MRKHQIFIFLLFVFVQMANKKSAERISLEEAIKQNKIEVKFYNNPKSTHYQTPIKAVLLNKKSEDFTVFIENGLILHPSDSNIQSIIISKNIDIPLIANNTKELNLNGFCINQSKSAPGDKIIKYTLSKKNINPKLAKLTNFIASKNYFNRYEAQQALWCITDNYDLQYIYSSDSILSNSLIKNVSQITGKPVPQTVYQNYKPIASKPQIFIKGKFTINYNTITNVRIAIFDTSYRCVKEIFNNPEMSAGEKNIAYEINSSEYAGKYYFVKLTINDEIKSHTKYDFDNGKIIRLSRRS